MEHKLACVRQTTMIVDNEVYLRHIASNSKNSCIASYKRKPRLQLNMNISCSINTV